MPELTILSTHTEYVDRQVILFISALEWKSKTLNIANNNNILLADTTTTPRSSHVNVPDRSEVDDRWNFSASKQPISRTGTSDKTHYLQRLLSPTTHADEQSLKLLDSPNPTTCDTVWSHHHHWPCAWPWGIASDTTPTHPHTSCRYLLW